MPVFSTLSTKRAIFVALVLSSMSWWCVRLMTGEQAKVERDALRASAARAYTESNYEYSARLYDRIVPMTDSAALKVVHLREQATAYGQAGKYGKQMSLMLKAQKLAKKNGLDSLRREASISIGNIYAACQRDQKFCKGIRPTSTLARWNAEKPLILLAIGLFLFSVYVLLDPRSE